MFDHEKGQDGVLVCRFRGRMDMELSNRIENDLFDVIQRANSPTTFDFKDVEYISSAFLRICVKAARAVKGRLKIVNISPQNYKVLEMTGLHNIFDVKKPEGSLP